MCNWCGCDDEDTDKIKKEQKDQVCQNCGKKSLHWNGQCLDCFVTE